MASVPPADSIPAATLVLMRDQPDGAPHILMIERASTMAFAAGAMVFPGGRIDPGDHVAAPSSPPDAAARIAAIRETIEEVGIAVGLHPAPDAPTIAAIRTGLATGRDMASLLADHALTLDLAALTPFARWRPNFVETRSFDTLFYIAASPAGAQAIADGGESVHAIWASAEAILADHAAGRCHLLFPTRCNLERLATFASLDAARAQAALFPPVTITPWVEQRDGEGWLCIPDDRGYPVTALPLAGMRRG